MTNPSRVLVPLWALLWLGSVVTAGAQEPNVSARTKVDPASGAWVGQAVNLDVEVLTTTWFRGVNDFPTVRIPGCVVVVPRTSGGNFSERIDGETVSGVRRRYLVYPQRDGRFEVPALDVTATVADANAQPIKVTVQTSPVSFSVRRPAATEGLSSWVTTPSLQVTERYDPKPRDLKVGDSFSRAVRITADTTTSMMIPPLTFTAPEGIAVYQSAPELDDRSNRGQDTATREDGATYVAEREGSYELRAIEINWWDPTTDRIHTEKLAALKLEVAANPDLAAEQWVSEAEPVEEIEAEETVTEFGMDRRMVEVVLAIAAVIAMVGWLLRRFGPALLSAFRTWLSERQNSEAAFYRRFQRATRSGDPAAALRALTEWLDRAAPRGPIPTVRQFAAAGGDPELTEENENLQDALFGRETGATSWSASKLERSVGTARSRFRRSDESSTDQPFPQLNP